MGDSQNDITSTVGVSNQEFNDNLQDMSNDEIYRLFIIGLLSESGISDTDDPEVEKMIDELVVRLDVFISQEVYMALPEDKKTQLSGLVNMELDSPEEVAKIYKDANLDMEKLVTDAMEKFRELYLKGLEEE